MKICIYGAGAIGGQIGAQLARSGIEVSLVARGPHLAAIQRNGLTLVAEGERFTVRPRATDNAAELGAQDFVFIALKAHGTPAAVPRLKPLLGPHTAVVTAMNGMPWWYFYKLAGPYEGRQIETVDPGGAQWRGIGPERAIGCVLWQAAEIVEPGVVELRHGNRMPIGEPDNSRSERAQLLSKAMLAAGLKSPVKTNIRDEIWMKLWGNLSFNPVSLLTQGTLERIASDPDTKPAVRAMMIEAEAIAHRLGVRFAMNVDKRIEVAREVGAHKTSMLQDLELGRPIELEALTGVVIELGRIVGVPTPAIEMVYGLARQRARIAGCYPESQSAAE
ncbi:MAG: 2-dehydropantoate 2-reductase [Alphaproteobacteria bacterium]|nr:2-dehydropantoate 2-reductase [Alphaproteobacteria bacterium]